MLTILLLYFPLIASVLAFMLKGQLVKKFALFAAMVELAISLYIYCQFDISTAETQFLVDYWWMQDLGISFKIGLDGVSMLMVLLTNLLVPIIILSSFKKEQESPAAFYGLILLMQMALLGVFMALDAFLFYVFWELALIPIYFICLLWGGENRAKITLKFFLYTLLGSLLMLIAFIYLYLQTPGAHSFDIDAFYALAISNNDQRWVFWCIFMAFAVKIPLFPFHTWQPDTYTNAPSQGTMLLSGIMLKMGIYGLFRWLLPVVPFGVQAYGYIAIVLGVIGIVYASVIALKQSDYKRLIAYSSIAHVGLIAAGVFTLNMQGMQGAMIQMFSHGVNVVGLFIIVDIIQSRLNTREMNILGGIRNVAPKFATFFVIIMLGSVALPLTNGFVGEFMLLNGLFQYNHVMAAVGATTVILGAVYMLGSFQKIMLGESNSLTQTFQEVSGSEYAVLLSIAALVILFGVYPKPLLDLTEPTVAKMLQVLSAKM